MKVLHLNTQAKGATFRTAKLLHESLQEKGHESLVITAIGNIGSYNHHVLSKSGVRSIGISRILRKFVFEYLLKDKEYYFYPDWNLDLLSAKEILSKVQFQPDIILLYWVKLFLTPKIIYDLKMMTSAKIFWVLMDMAPFTGGCNYSFGCERFSDSCGKCPGLGARRATDLSSKLLEQKKKYIADIDISIISPTTTLTHQVSRSAVFRHKNINTVLLGIDSLLFKPGDKKVARQSLGLPLDKKIVFFGSQKLSSKRKGMQYLIESLKSLAIKLPREEQNGIFLAYAGTEDSLQQPPFSSKYLGFLDEEELVAAYQAADVFVCPSIEDSGPVMINESLMCGTPVVAFDMGVAPDLVHNDLTGYKAELKNSEDMANGISKVLGLSDRDYDNLSENCRRIALEKSEMKKQNETIYEIITTSEIR